MKFTGPPASRRLQGETYEMSPDERKRYNKGRVRLAKERAALKKKGQEQHEARMREARASIASRAKTLQG